MDKKQKKEIIIMAVGAVILGLLLANNLGKVKVKTASSTVGDIADKVFQKAAPKKEVPRKDIADTDTQWGRDPFTLHETGGGGEGGEYVSGLTLVGITEGAGIMPSAIINDEIVKEGSKIGKFTVLSIKKDRVTVTDGKDKLELLIDR